MEEAWVSVCCIIPWHGRQREVAEVAEGKRGSGEEGPTIPLLKVDFRTQSS